MDYLQADLRRARVPRPLPKRVFHGFFSKTFLKLKTSAVFSALRSLGRFPERLWEGAPVALSRRG